MLVQPAWTKEEALHTIQRIIEPTCSRFRKSVLNTAVIRFIRLDIHAAAGVSYKLRSIYNEEVNTVAKFRL